MDVFTTGLTGQLLQGILAIVLGVGGMMAYYFGANALVDRLGDGTKQAVRPWVFIAPALIILGVFLVYPTVQTIIISFYGPDTEEFVGTANYEWALGFTDGQPNAPEIWDSLRNNLLWLLIVPAFSTGFGLLVAILADRVAWENLAKAIIFLPMAISFVGASVIWRFIYFRDPDVGLLNAIAVGFGGEPVSWLSTTFWSNFPLLIILI
ncbi:MAG: sugar ABC transporter permease, partial [Chloroflexota bacterium]